MKVSDLIKFMEKIAPPELAEEWDNVGLLIGNKRNTVSKIMVSLDLDMSVLNEAIEKNADLIVTHHPVIFKPLSSINNDLYIKTIKNDICVYSAHTNLDTACGGVNDVLARVLGLKDVTVSGMMRIGNVETQNLSDFILNVKKSLGSNSLRVTDINDISVEKVAVLGGNGGDLVYTLDKSICDVYVTGEASYHHAQYAHENGFALITAGHFETENPVVEKLVELISENFDIEVLASKQKNVYNTK